MSILCDKTIREKLDSGEIKISPFPNDIQFQPASIDLKLADDFIVRGKRMVLSEEIWGDGLILGVQDSILASTVEKITLPNNLIARVEGRSSLGRQFLNIHSTAGFVDPGFSGNITLELTNNGKETIDSVPGMRICQITFEELNQACLRAYGHPELGSRYQNQEGVTESRL